MDKPSRDGGFSDPSFVTVGDPYSDRPEGQPRGLGGDRKPFLTCPPKRGQTGATLGPGARKFEAMTGEYAEQYKLQARRRLANTAKFVKPNGFVYSSPAQEHTGAGDYYGAFGKFGRDEDDVKRAQEENARPPANPKEREFEKKNMLTQPGKRGTFGYAGTLIGGHGVEAMSADFGSERREALKDLAAHHAKVGEKKPFKSTTEGVDFFDSHEHVAASRVFGWDEQCIARPPGALELMNPKERAAAQAATFKPWRPNHPTKDGKDGAFDKFPESQADPYDEKVVNRAMLPLRRNPVNVATADLPDALKERKAFKPSSGPKTKLSRSTCLMGISKHHI